MVFKTKDKGNWKEILEKLEIGDIYFLPEYYEMHEKYGDGEAYCFVYKDDNSVVVYPFLKNKINDLGYKLDDEYYDIQGAYGYNGVVGKNINKNVMQNFEIEFQKFAKQNNIVAEFLRFHPLIGNHSNFKKHCEILFNRYTVAVNLEKSFEDTFDEFSSSSQRGYKKAKKNDLYVEVYREKYPYKNDFKEMYLQTMERVGANDYVKFDDKYFDHLFNELNPTHFIVKQGKTVIASSICLNYGDYSNYHLGASYEEYLNLRPNNILFVEMIKQAKKDGYKYLHLGGGATSEKDDGLLRFKKNFSKNVFEFYIGKKVHRPNIYSNILKQWEKSNKLHFQENKHILLGYREVNNV